ncbi:MAG: hypothetical protein WBQ94_24880 [Terracidiphilus sp.]
MTIAAGFCCSDGVVLCADTQYTIPETMKYPDSKLRMAPELQCLPFFAFCGDMDYQKQCIASFTSVLSSAEEDGTLLRSALEKSALEMHIAYYDAYSDPSEKLSAAMFVSVLIGGKRKLYKVYGPKVYEVDQFESMGSGSYLARALADSFWEPNNTMYRTALAAVYILSDVKKYVDGCGGESQMVCLGHDGSWQFFSPDNFERTRPIANIESHYQTWKRKLGSLLLDSQNLRESQEFFETKATGIRDELAEQRRMNLVLLRVADKRGNG